MLRMLRLLLLKISVYELELKDCDAGIAILSVNKLQKGGYTQSGKWKILANPLLVTIVPAISIAADFEQTPTVNVEFTFLDHYIPLSTPVYCVRLASTSKNYWTRSKCVLVRRNTTTVQCTCSVMGYLTVVASRGSEQLGRMIETDAFGNLHYHQSYTFRLHKPLLIGSAVLSLLILLVIAFALLSSLCRNLRSTKRQFVNSFDQLDKLNPSIKNYDLQMSGCAQQSSNDESNDKTFNQIQKQTISSSSKDNQMHLLKELDNKQFYRRRTFNSQYCSQTQLNWLILICLFTFIQLFWCTGVLFPGDAFTIYKLWNKIITIYRGHNQLKPIFVSSSWSFNLQSQTDHLINFIDGQQYCLNFALILHFLFTSCSIWMLLNTFHLYRHLRRSKLNEFKFDSIFNYSTRQFAFNCCSFNYAKSTESLISKPINVCSPTNGSATASASNQISSIEQLVEELNQKDLNQKDRKEHDLVNGVEQPQTDNLINENSIKNLKRKSSPVSCSPSKLPKKASSKRALSQKVIYFLEQIKRHLNTFAYYSVSWIIAVFITILSYKLNPAGYETKRYCWMSIEGGITYSFIVPVSFFIMLNTILVLLALRQYLHLQRIHQQLNSASVYDVHDLVKHELYLALHRDYYQNVIQEDQLIKNEFNDELTPDDELIDEELIICVDCEDN